jgi:hypothetical protein
MNLLTVASMAGFSSVVYLTAQALFRTGHDRPAGPRYALLAGAALIALAAAGVVAHNDSRDAVIGFVIGGLLTPIVSSWARRRGSPRHP